ncbi:MAG: DUF3592 domain-containing protein [Opitutales bacterium]
MNGQILIEGSLIGLAASALVVILGLVPLLPKTLRGGILLFGFAFGLFCVSSCSIGAALESERMYQESAYWSTTSGTINSASMRTETRRRDGTTKRRHSFDVAYTYEVDGETFQGDRYAIGGYENSRGNIERLVQRYAPGTEVDVLYDPDEPGESALVRTSSASPLWLVLSAIPAVLGVVIVFKFLSGRRARKQGT